MSNKKARQDLERLFGKGCMFKKADIEEKIARKYKIIKSYKRFVKETKYKSKKIKKLERTLTYHHLKHKADGGEKSVQNGALVNELAHRYMHSLPREQEEIINNMIQEYKLSVCGSIMLTTDTEITIPSFIIASNFDLDDDYITIPVYDGGREHFEQKFNRAKEKLKAKKFIENELYEYYNDDIDDELEL